MSGIIIAAVVVSCTGLLLGLFLGVMGKKFYVEVDQKEIDVRAELPGNNCGGCGYAGCDALAKAIAAGEAPANACPVGGAPVASKIGAIMGEEVGESVRMTAFVKCAGDCDKATEFFSNIPKISRKLKTLCDVGLGYIKIGQPATTLSGGEAQRVKLATELSKRPTGKTVYILDEPTTGLHIADVHKLVDVLQKLVDSGNTVIVIEHNLDLIKAADYIIDLGPEGGSGGGTIVGTGTPEEIALNENSYTGQYLKKFL